VHGRYAGIVMAGFVAVAATVGATTATTTTWTVQPGGPVSAKSGKLILTDTTTGVVLTCPSTGMHATLKSGSGLPGTGIGSIASVNLTKCASDYPPVNPGMTATGLPWHVNVASYNATKRVATGSLSHVQIKIKSTGLTCAAVVNGTSAAAADGLVKFSYTDSTATLNVLTTGGNLHIYHVNGCAGLLNGGDLATLSVTYTLSPAQTIMSP
jgi:hypothetical protein